ncbi:MAG: yusO 1 [Ilumatobacteraceae bacterium]|nr:yusO 1 [Ilumatobacteraceae bacterium]
MPRRPLRFDPVAEARRNWVERGWLEAADGMALVTSVMRVHQILLARVDDALAPFGLTFARYEVLMLLTFTRTGQMPLGKIGQRLQVHPASVTNVIDRLESDGLVQRRPHPTDMRTTLAVISVKGRRLAARATEVLNRDVFAEVGPTPEALQELFTTMADLRRAAGDFDPTPQPTH